MNIDPLQPELGTPPPAADARQVAALREELSALRTHVNLGLLLVLLAGLPVAAYLMKQNGIVRRQADAVEAQHRKTLEEFEKTFRPAAASFVTTLMNYSKTHPDYAPILTKNGVTFSTNNAPAPAPSAVPAGPAAK